MNTLKRAFLAASFAVASATSFTKHVSAEPLDSRVVFEERSYYEKFAYSLNSNVRVFLLGEFHDKKASSLFGVQVLLPILKQKGFTGLALECDQSIQPFIDEYYLKETTDTLELISSFLVKGYNPGNFLPFILAARKNGVNSYCIDYIPLDSDPQKISYSDFIARDFFMAENIRSILRNHDKVLVLVGYSHTKSVPFDELHLFGKRFIMVPLKWLLDNSLGPENVFSLTVFLRSDDR